MIEELHQLIEKADNLRVSLVWQLEENVLLRRQFAATVAERMERAKRMQRMLLRQTTRAAAYLEPEKRKAG